MGSIGSSYYSFIIRLDTVTLFTAPISSNGIQVSCKNQIIGNELGTLGAFQSAAQILIIEKLKHFMMLSAKAHAELRVDMLKHQSLLANKFKETNQLIYELSRKQRFYD